MPSDHGAGNVSGPTWRNADSDTSRSPTHRHKRRHDDTERRKIVNLDQRDHREQDADQERRGYNHVNGGNYDDSYGTHDTPPAYGKSRYQDRSRSHHKSDDRWRSRSPVSKRRRRSDGSPLSPLKKSHAPLPSQDESFRGESKPRGAEFAPVEQQKPNFKPTGLLAKEANTVAGTTTVLKYHEPSEARKPPARESWRMYVFKKQDMIDTIDLWQRSAWLIGRDKNVTDLHLEHPSISKQHAVIQFRHITKTNEYGDKASKVKPYLIDLQSANGTKMNGRKIEASKYIELMDQDVVAFGDSEREYVLMLPSSDG